MSTLGEIVLFIVLETGLVAVSVYFGWRLRRQYEEARR